MIPVCWYEGVVGCDAYSAQFANEGIQGRSRYACTGILNDAFDSYGDLFQHFSGWDGLPRPLANHAVVIVHGGHLRYQANQINQAISELDGVLIIGIGDEEQDFPYNALSHRNMKLWTQSPDLSKPIKSDRYVMVGYPCDCRENLVHGQERIYNFFFAGQITHVRREECVRALKNLHYGKILETKQFYSGMPHDEYFKTLGQAKIIPCPSGPVCSDTFRLAEALEAGAVPVVDEWPGWKGQPTTGFWKKLLPDMPFPVVENWADFPRVMDSILVDYKRINTTCKDWWASYKAQYFGNLIGDLKALGAKI